MLNKFLKSIFLRVYIAKLISGLQSLNELYLDRDFDEYHRKVDIFYAELVKFPQLNLGAEPGIHNGLLTTIYSDHSELILKLEQSIDSRNMDAINRLSDDIRQFLDKLYQAALPQKRASKRKKHLISVAGIIVFVLLVAVSFSPLKERYYEERQEYDLMVNEEAFKAATLTDILALKEALQKYYNNNKSYPKSSGGFDGIIAAHGESKKNWIPGLAPEYIQKLPVDPRKSKDSGKQYMYKSDGKDFKLIAHNPLGIEEVVSNHPELVDPIRPSWAFGAWSEGAKNW